LSTNSMAVYANFMTFFNQKILLTLGVSYMMCKSVVMESGKDVQPYKSDLFLIQDENFFIVGCFY
jgi:hypothetical protein